MSNHQRTSYDQVGPTLQRLFSTFPNSWPGIGLTLIRFCLGVALLYFATTGLAGKSAEPIALVQRFIAGAGCLFLLAGLWTPAVGVLVSLNEISIALSFASLREEYVWIHIFVAAIAASVAMLGPGAWSIDARLYGRKRFHFDRSRGQPLP